MAVQFSVRTLVMAKLGFLLSVFGEDETMMIDTGHAVAMEAGNFFARVAELSKDGLLVRMLLDRLLYTRRRSRTSLSVNMQLCNVM